MKVGILTWYIGYNLGAALQTLALQKKTQEILDVCYDDSICEVVHYQTTDQNKGYLLSRRIRWGISKDIWKSLTNLRMVPVMCQKKKAVDCFLEEYVAQSSGYTEEDIASANKVYDVFLCGSDQIWNPNWLDKNYLLDFAESEKKRISYASSVGVDEIPDEISDIYRDNLSKFDRLSVRENAGKKAIEKIGIGG